MRSFAISLVVAFVMLSALADSGATLRVITGTVVDFEAGEWVSVASEQTDPGGVRITLRGTTAYEGEIAAITPGIRVTVWHRYVGERRAVAERIRLSRPNPPTLPNPKNL